MARVCEGECMGCSPGDEPHTLTRYRCCGLSHLGVGNLSVAEPYEGENLYLFFSFLSCFSFTIPLFLA